MTFINTFNLITITLIHIFHGHKIKFEIVLIYIESLRIHQNFIFVRFLLHFV